VTDSFISYAQNFEDVMLWRALKNVESGFYIDIGAHAPVADSVTKAFYDRGWKGINLEPHIPFWRNLLEGRPRDINLSLAVGERAADMTLYVVGDTGLATLDPGEAELRASEGWVVTTEVVHVDTLAAIWAAHVPPNQPVHFLKVDVEGVEREVLVGNDWKVCRPWVVVVEATRPSTTQPSFHLWEQVLTSADYEFAYGDGLNRFYVAREHLELAQRFEYPPNVFDRFLRVAEFDAMNRAAQAEAELWATKASRSWRWTRPLRSAVAFGQHMRRALRESLRSRLGS
jgi:FkbM family methyltransferase